MQASVQILAQWITAVIAYGGYPGLIALMALESACLPIPSELIMPFAGYLASIGHINLWLAATLGALGCNIGSAVAYEVGFWGGRPFLERWGRYVLLDHRELDQVDRIFARFGAISVLVGRMLPIIRTFIALPAGIGRMNRLTFHLFTFVGSWPWCYGLAWVGYQLGTRWNDDPALHAVMHSLNLAVAILVLGAIAFFVFTRVRALRVQP